MKKRYGIMGGTFDPIHYGHLMIAEYLRESMDIYKVIFIPTGNPPHKSKLTDAKTRFEMTKIAIEDNDFFEISSIESDSTKSTYSIETVSSLKRDEDADYIFIIGSDSLFNLETWKDFRGLSELVKFACFIRPGYDDIRKITDKVESLKDQYSSDIEIVKSPEYSISSTEIRDRVKILRSIRYLVPDKVIEYIYKNGLYRN